MRNRKTLLMLIPTLLFAISVQAQLITTTSFRANPFETINKAKAEADNNNPRLTRISSSIYEINFEYIVRDGKSYAVEETMVDFLDPIFDYRAEFEYDENMNLTKNKGFTSMNGSWVFTSYEEFEYDELGRKTIRINANNLYGDGFEIGGRGYFTYNSEGLLSEYRQEIHWGNDVYENLNKDNFSYIDGRLSETLSYFYQNGDWLLTSKVEYEYDDDGLLISLSFLSYEPDAFTWFKDSKYVWTRREDGKVLERNYYLSNYSGAWANNSSDKYEFFYDEDETLTPIYPSFTNHKHSLENWFVPEVNGLPNKIIRDNWWTEDINSHILTFVDSSVYEYETNYTRLCSLIPNEDIISIYPNPAKDNLNIVSSAIIETYSIYNVMGVELIRNRLGSNKGSIDISNLSSGVYFLETMDSNNRLKRDKFIVN